MKKSKKLLEQIVEELRKTPVVSVVCQKFGIARHTFYRWRQIDPDFDREVSEALDIGSLVVNDICMSQLIASIQNGNMGSVKYWMSNKHSDFIRPRKKHPEDTSSKLPFSGISIQVVTEKQVSDDPDEVMFPKENTINDSDNT
ncbi:hypothetical protein CL684_02320 [Candidatus Campbellbacteria bacterium]|nr:hypothetical protein [Candidatus Campbellbacteria bacterium]|tara:strand:+ start:881 stop:1309 length:429 start_codon:yes stop_codon:yes gene_type:complete